MRNRDETLIFLHLPKTGGSTLSRILERHYSPRETLTLDAPGLAELKTLPDAQRARYRLIQGHLYFGLHRLVPGASTYVTFLRRPVERVLSFYYHASSKPDHYLYPSLTTERLNLKTLLARNLTEELCNLQTRMLAGEEWEDPQRIVTRAALDQAKANLRSHFRFVGLMEEFDASLLLLHRAFDWPLHFYVKENVAKEKPPGASLDVETRRMVAEANSLDFELYEYVGNLFAEECRAAGDSLAVDLVRFRRSNAAYGRLVPRFARSLHRIICRTQNSLRFNKRVLAWRGEKNRGSN